MLFSNHFLELIIMKLKKISVQDCINNQLKNIEQVKSELQKSSSDMRFVFRKLDLISRYNNKFAAEYAKDIDDILEAKENM